MEVLNLLKLALFYGGILLQTHNHLIITLYRAPDKEAYIALFPTIYLFNHPTKPYGVRNQKNRLNRTILLSTCTYNIGL